MKSKERIVNIVVQSAVLVAIAVVIIVLAGSYGKNKKDDSIQESESEKTEKEFNLWYCHEKYEPYLNEAATRYEEKTGIKVNVIYCSGLDYLENISDANKNGNGPDLFIESEENMQKIVYLGLAEQNYEDSFVNEDNYLNKSINSITFNKKQYGYPLGFQTAVMAVNMAYVDELPDTFDDIKAFADNFNSEGSDNSHDYSGVESILKWDVKPIEFSYGFLGSYMNVGGEYGDDGTVIDVNGESTVKAGEYFYSLAQYFYMDIDNISYDNVLDDFVNGKIIYTIADTDILKKLNENQVNAELITLPGLTDELETKEVSTTSMLFINPYADMKDEARDFAKFISYDMADEMYDITGTVISAKKITYDNKYLNSFVKAYEQSVGMPKLMYISDYWIKAGTLMENIWKGNDVTELLNSFEEELKQRMN